MGHFRFLYSCLSQKPAWQTGAAISSVCLSRGWGPFRCLTPTGIRLCNLNQAKRFLDHSKMMNLKSWQPIICGIIKVMRKILLLTGKIFPLYMGGAAAVVLANLS